MKFFLFFLLLAFFSLGCNKNNDNNDSNYSGNFVGNVDVYINNNFLSTQSKSISLSTSNTNGLYMMTNNIFMSTTCNISGNNLMIPSTITATNATFKVVEYGTGTFAGNTLTIEFFQDQVSLSNNTVIGTGKWRGTLTKQ